MEQSHFAPFDLPDVLRAVGHRLARQGAMSVAISGGSHTDWIVTYVADGEPGADCRTDEFGGAVRYTSADLIAVTREARSARTHPEGNEAPRPVPLSALLRAAGKEMERTGCTAFLLLANHQGVVATGQQCESTTVRLIADEVQQVEVRHDKARRRRRVIFHPGETWFYQPRHATTSVIVTVRRLGKHQITVQLPDGIVLPVHRKWLRPMTETAPVMLPSTSVGTPDAGALSSQKQTRR